MLKAPKISKIPLATSKYKRNLMLFTLLNLTIYSFSLFFFIQLNISSPPPPPPPSAYFFFMQMKIGHRRHPVGLDRNRSRPNKETKMMMNRRKVTTRNKGIAMERDYDVDLLVSINHAEGLDNPSSYPSVTTRDHRVVFWVHPDDQLATCRDAGSPDPAWNQKCRIRLDKSKDCRFLYVEVLRYGSSDESNPGTSNGISVVGRAQIPLPNLSCETAGRYGLVRPKEDACKAEGHVILSMKLVKIDII